MGEICSPAQRHLGVNNIAPGVIYLIISQILILISTTWRHNNKSHFVLYKSNFYFKKSSEHIRLFFSSPNLLNDQHL